MSAFPVEQWTNLYIAGAGASAALAGLVIVAVSVNIKQIIRFPYLPSRAAATIATLILILLVCMAGLIPGQSLIAFGVEVLVFTVFAWILESIANYHSVIAIRKDKGSTFTAISSVVLGQIQIIPFVIGGILLILDHSVGLYWIVAGILAILIVSIINAWVLLVEILR